MGTELLERTSVTMVLFKRRWKTRGLFTQEQTKMNATPTLNLPS